MELSAGNLLMEPPQSETNARVRSSDPVSLQFYWQGYDAYVHCKRNESMAPCLYNAQCASLDQTERDDELVHIMPVEELRERWIVSDMKVQVVSASTGKYLRASRVSRFLKWSTTRDERTVFQIQILDGQTLTFQSKFTLASAFWSDHSIGFTQSFPLGGGRELSKAMGLLTIEKKKHQAPLIFPLRFRAVSAEQRASGGAGAHNRAPQSNGSESSSSSLSSSFLESRSPPPVVTISDVEFIENETDPSLSELPVAMVVPSTSRTRARSTDSDEIVENCMYCGILFRQREGLMAHLRDYHGNIMHRTPVPGAFCIHCGQRRVDGACPRCGS